MRWCKNASDHAGGKPWRYLVIPHEQVTEDKRLQDYLQYERKVA